MGIGDWGLGIGDWGLGIGPNPHENINFKNDYSDIRIFKYKTIIYIFIYIKKYGNKY